MAGNSFNLMKQLEYEEERLWDMHESLMPAFSKPSRKIESQVGGEQVYQSRVFTNSKFKDDDWEEDASSAWQDPTRDEVPGEGGETPDTSERSENTIITTDGRVEVKSVDGMMPALTEVASSTEGAHRFQSILNRWIPIEGFEVETKHAVGEIVQQYQLPASIIRKDACTPNTLPFEQFIYGSFRIKMLFKVNANKFQCGKAIVSVIPDSPNVFQSNKDKPDANKNIAHYYSAQSAVMRGGLMIDLCSNNEVVLDIPWVFHRSKARATTSSSNFAGVVPGVYCLVLFQVISPLNVTQEQSPRVSVTPFVKFEKANFTAMSYKKPLPQVIEEGLAAVADISTGIAKAANKIRASKLIQNLDKPTVFDRVVGVVPRARLGFSGGKGVVDAIPLRLDPYSATTFSRDLSDYINVVSLKQLMRMWGICRQFAWNVDQKAGDQLFEFRVQPTNLVHADEEYGGKHEYTPLETFMSFFSFWRGTIECRLEFVCTAFHTGSIMVSVEFGRPASGYCESASTYTKIFDVGESKVFEFTIPYIYDTVWRRTGNVAFLGYWPLDEDKKEYKTVGTAYKTFAIVRFRVVNKLKPISSVPTSIWVMLFVRAGKDFVANGFVSVNSASDAPNEDHMMTSWPWPDDSSKTYKEEGCEQNSWGLTHVQPTSKPIKELKGKKVTYEEYLKVYPEIGEQKDRTRDFSSGLKLYSIQNNEWHLDIKDILRTPLKIVCDQSVGGWNSSAKNKKPGSIFFIPLCPPQTNLITGAYGTKVFPRCNMMAPHVRILDSFRFWRGSMRYTIFANKFVQAPIYVYYVPQGGCRILGTQDFMFKDDQTFTNFDLGCLGLPAEVIVSTVNPSVTLEVPFQTVANWALLHQGQQGGTSNFAWRDRSDENVGHLMIVCKDSVSVDVWWSAGDDFCVAGVLGLRTMCRYDSIIWTDDAPKKKEDDKAKAQIGNMCMVAKDTFMNNVPQIKKLAKPAALYWAGCLFPPVAALCNVMAIGDLYWQVCKIVEDVQEMTCASKPMLEYASKTVPAVIEDVHGTTREVKSLVGELRPNVNNVLVQTNTILTPFSYIAQLLTGLASNLASLFDMGKFSGVINWVTEKLTSSWQSFVENINLKKISDIIVDLLVFLGVVVKDSIEVAKDSAWKVFKRMGLVENQSHEEDMRGVLVGLLVGGISAMCGVKVRGGYSTMALLSGLFVRFFHPSTISVVSIVTRYFKDFYLVIKRVLYMVIGWQDADVEALKLFSERSEFLQKFIQDATLLLNDANNVYFQRTSLGKSKFWITVCNAQIILQKLAAMPRNDVSPALAQLCRDVIKKSNENYVLLANNPMRYEPFVICVEGGTGIGKSFLTTAMCCDLLKAIGFNVPVSEFVFVRNPGTEYWNGYKDQPIVVYDDWMNIRGVQAETQISEFFNLKSSAINNLNMARLEEKDIRANPIIVVLLTNNAFPDLEFCNDKRAVLRRRDLVIKAIKKEEWKMRKTREIPREILKEFKHLDFQISESSEEPLYGEKFEYGDLMREVNRQFVDYHNQEKQNIKERLEKFMDTLPEYAQKLSLDDDPFKLFYSAMLSVAEEPSVHTNSFMPSEVLRQEAERVLAYLETSVEGQADIFDLDDSEIEQACEYMELNSEAGVYTGLCVDCMQSHVVYAFCQNVDDSHIYCISCLMARAPTGIRLEQSFAYCEKCKEQNKASPMVLMEYGHQTVLTNVMRRISCDVIHSGNYRRIADRMNMVDMSQQYVKPQRVVSAERIREFWERERERRVVEELDRLCSNCALQVPAHPYVHEDEDVVHEDFQDPEAEPERPGSRFMLLPGLWEMILSVLKRLGKRIAIALTRSIMRCGSAFWKIFFASSQVSFNALLISCLYHAFFGSNILEMVMHGSICVVWFLADDLGLMKVGPITRLINSMDNGVDAFLQWADTGELPNNVSIRWSNESMEAAGESLGRLYDEQTRTRYEGMLRVRAQMTPEDWADRMRDVLIRISDYDETKCVDVDECKHVITEKGGRLVPFMAEYDRERDEFFCESITEGRISVPNAACKGVETCRFRGRGRLAYMVAFASAPERFLNLDTLIINNRTDILPQEFFPREIPEQTRSFIEKIKGMTDKVWSLCCKGFEWCKTFLGAWKFVAIGLGIVATATAWMWAFKVSTVPEAAAYDISGFTRGMRAHRSAMRNLRIERLPRAQNQMLNDAVMQKIVRNCGCICALDGDRATWINFVGLKGRKALIMKHYQPRINLWVKRGMQVGVRMHMEKTFVPIEVENLVFEDLGSDLVVVEFPPQVPMFADVIKFMPTEKDIQEVPVCTDADMVRPPTVDRPNVCEFAHIEILRYLPSQIVSGDEGDYTIEHVMEYNYSRKGACGSLILTSHNERPLYAVHVAGTGEGNVGRGYGVILTQELFDKESKEMASQNLQEFLDEFVDPDVEPVAPQFEGIEILGTVKGRPVFQPVETQYVRSSIALFLPPPSTSPVMLSSFDDRWKWPGKSPLWCAVGKQAKIEKEFPRKFVEMAKRILEAKIRRCRPTTTCKKPLTWKEAALGIPGLKYYDPIEWQTSSGWPYCVNASNSTKNPWVNLNGTIKKELRDDLTKREEMRDRGEIPVTVFTDFLKDERRPNAKFCKPDSTRLINGSNVANVLEMRKYLLHFCAAVMKERIYDGVAVGMNPDGPEWGELYRYLKEHSDNVLAMDYSNFGPSFSSQVFEAVIDVIVSWHKDYYDERDLRQVEAILRQNQNSLHVVKNVLYRQYSGSPSGSAMTSIINSLVNNMYLLIAWVAKFGGEVEDCLQRLRVVTYGDDFLATTTEPSFNMRYLEEWLGDFGVKLTPENKEGDIKEFTSLEECTFLKRGFVAHPRRSLQMLAPLPEYVIEDCAKWIAKGDEKVNTLVNCDMSLRLAWTRGPTYFKRWKKTINKALREIGWPEFVYSWEYIDSAIFDKGVCAVEDWEGRPVERMLLKN